jgi:preprotein translocase subunit SecE
MAGFYYFATWNGEPVSVLLRVVGLLVTTGAAIAIASTTQQGQRLVSFLRDSRMEVRKMVWPTKQETLQTTLIVMVIVLVLAIFLWIVDTILGYGVKILFGGA